ncbi:very-long-chain (3R)-3-hydroxyacyl-CoA dehydratase PASTICCINO 2A isoform X3 [Capsicum annuum]|uniref:very-long-chain (3R)-3-hydroxyacyl-CoA dehydratase PASTICCINO 2A isoform X3 n=1 Tax=Capsicum annuum TaxID=4072 RepID=UPI001FB142A0|nr:very-long-chain (3R)-3-hydroxyacyl-CoA dehydratase PASTICCINO 2A isoform X3 [Capsicum annuum]
MARFLSGVRCMYLFFYNWIVFFGWFQVFYFGVKTLNEFGHEHVYDAVEKPLLFAQTAAFLEVLHSLVGLVRSPVSATLPQITSRLYVTWGILWSFPEVRSHILVSSLVISWSITEIIRYSFFGTREAFGSAPSWLLWLRNLESMLLGCQTNGISLLITTMHHLLALPSMYQAVLTCIVTCLGRERKQCLKLRRHRWSLEDYLYNF